MYKALPYLLKLTPLAVLTFSAIPSGFNEDLLQKVEKNLEQIATHSWEIGTQAEALLEIHAPSLTVWEKTAFPPSNSSNPKAKKPTQPVLDIAKNIVQDRTVGLPLISGDGAAGDPASLGVAILVANWTRSDPNDDSFADAAKDQLTWLTNHVPRTKDGAISHRQAEVQLWADSVYMVPPFLAYYGALQGGHDGLALMQEAYDQCRLYRQYLRDDSGLWKHIVLGSSKDYGHWGTGNAWAAAGMLRVLETLKNSNYSKQLTKQQVDLTQWVDEIVGKVWEFQQPNGTLLNVIDSPTSFGDTSSTALLAASTFRFAAITGNYTHIPAAGKAMKLIRDSIDKDGWLHNTVDPIRFNVPSAPGTYSPEGQAFVLLLHAGWKALMDSMKRPTSNSDE